ncbi:MAG TPA: hypothetical protein H9755_10425 [Candidatus Dietzia intestinigallinarum]|nr:hypothetical protein [Candidatus Dietzia intestinigallinarum]
MLVAALGLTILGFAFLVAAVATGSIGWAWACIAVGALGLLLLLIDLIRGRGGPGGEKGHEPADDPTRAHADHPTEG